MLAHVLALIVGLGSFALYMAAFFFPEIHRKNDFIWSGVGLFYALVLWVCAGRITGGVLLGQMAGVTLLGWLAWQTVLLRRQLAPIEQQTAIPSVEDIKESLGNLSSPEGRSQLIGQATRLFSQVKEGVQGAISTATQPIPQPSAIPEERYTPPSLEEFGTAGQEAIERFAKAALPEEETPETKEIVVDEVGEVGEIPVPSISAAPEAVKAVSTPTFDRAVEQSQPNVVKVIAETIQSLLKSFTKKKESKPVYVRKQYREDEPDTESSVTDIPKPKKGSKPVYVRKQYRKDEPITELPVTDATVISVVETIDRASDGSLVADTAIEIISDEIAPDLLAGALADATTEEIVEELLEEISVQEEAVEQQEAISESQAALGVDEQSQESMRAVPPHAPKPELVEAAIADAEEKGLPYDPPELEEETNW